MWYSPERGLKWDEGHFGQQDDVSDYLHLFIRLASGERRGVRAFSFRATVSDLSTEVDHNHLFFEPRRIMSRKLAVIPELCSGCRMCELACAIEHYGVNNPKKSAIRVLVTLSLIHI